VLAATLATPAAMPSVQQMTGKPRQTMEMPTNIQPKAAVPRALSSILPSMAGSPIRPASSVSTQTGGSTQMSATSTQVQTQKAQTKVCLSTHAPHPYLLKVLGEISYIFLQTIYSARMLNTHLARHYGINVQVVQKSRTPIFLFIVLASVVRVKE
jgi:hypothetical protein